MIKRRYFLLFVFLVFCNISNADAITCNAGRYQNRYSCSNCGGNNYYCPGGTWDTGSIQGRYTVTTGYYSTGGNSNTRTGQSQCGGNQYYCVAGVRSNVSSGYYSTGGDENTRTGQSQCGGNQYYCSAGLRNDVLSGYYSTGGNSNTRTGQSQCGGNQYYCVAGVRSNVYTGYYSTGGDTTTRTGQSQCTGATWCSNGVQNDCPIVESGWTAVTGTGWTSYSSCRETKTGQEISEYCSAGVLTKTANSATSWGNANVTTTLQAAPGSRISGQSCMQCTGATFSSGGTISSCTNCPANYAANTESGKTADSQCQISCAAGTYLTVATGTNCGSIPAGSWRTTAELVGYRQTGTYNACPAGSYCTGGAAAPIACANGSYQTTTGRAVCSACAAGRTNIGTGNSSSTCSNCTNLIGVSTWYSQTWTANTVTNLCRASNCVTGYNISGSNCAPKTYTLALNANGGTAGSVPSVTATYNASIPAISESGLPSRKGYAFDGYWSTPNGGVQYITRNGASTQEIWMTDSNAILYAMWEQIGLYFDGKVIDSLYINGKEIGQTYIDGNIIYTK